MSRRQLRAKFTRKRTFFTLDTQNAGYSSIKEGWVEWNNTIEGVQNKSEQKNDFYTEWDPGNRISTFIHDLQLHSSKAVSGFSRTFRF